MLTIQNFGKYRDTIDYLTVIYPNEKNYTIVREALLDELVYSANCGELEDIIVYEDENDFCYTQEMLDDLGVVLHKGLSLDEISEYFVESGVCTEDALDLVVMINGLNMETLDDIYYACTAEHIF